MRSSRIFRAALSLLCAGSLLGGCATPPRPRAPAIRPFASDGCSLFPDGTYEKKALWRDCCVEHDIAYWQGGTEAQRRDADQRLYDCVLEKTGDAALAKTMYDAVRVWGAPLFPSWYRWGYGWRYGRAYQPLSTAEQQAVDAAISQIDP